MSSLLNEGQIVRDTYEIERLIGEGAFAEVYRVKHRFLGRQAMKVFKTVGMTIEEVQGYLEEAFILSRVEHRHIIRVFESNFTETSQGIFCFFTMEYVPGGSLEHFWRSYGAQFVPLETSIEIIKQVCNGIAVAHSRNPPIIHRDLKPQNILVGYEQDGLRARVSDFGLAKSVNPLTLLASAKGTRCFKSPEVFQDTQCDSRAGDVWALGSVLYLLLTDRLPFSQEGEMDVFDSSCFDKPMVPPSKVNLMVDTELDQILAKALAMDPKDRYPTAMEFLKDLNKWKPPVERKKAQMAKAGMVSDSGKMALGLDLSADRDLGEKLAENALRLARENFKLQEAADLMEEAFKKWPNLRQSYENRVKLWRRNISY